MKTKTPKVATGRTGNPTILSLELIQAKKKLSLFDGLSRAEYEKKIRSFSDCDLSTYASKIGLRPSGDRRMLTLGLLKEYDNAVRTYEKYSNKAFTDIPTETRQIDNNLEQFLGAYRV